MEFSKSCTPKHDGDGNDPGDGFQTYDVDHEHAPSNAVDSDRASFLTNLTRIVGQTDSPRIHVVRLFWAARRAHLIRSDILSFRIQGYQRVKLSADFTDLQLQSQPYTGRLQTSDDFLNVVQIAVGAVVAECASRLEVTSMCQMLDTEIDRRLRIPSLRKEPQGRKRVVLVGGGFSFGFRRGLFKAARGLGIDLIVFDNEGHWLQSPSGAHLREQFVAVDTTPDDTLAARILQGIQCLALEIHGITTFADGFLPATAEVASILGLPTEPVQAFRTCVDKAELRQGMMDPIVLRSARDADVISTTGTYPQILKPVRGAGSVDVYIVRSAEELLTVSSKLFQERSQPVLMEAYVDGPEVDVNFVLSNGRILFCEVVDDFPKSAECEFFSLPKSFRETINVIPCGLSEQEQRLLKYHIHERLVQLGFANGVFHVEARVKNSRNVYHQSKTHLLDLMPRSDSRNCDIFGAEPSVYVVEINARPPGHRGTSAAAHAYGE